MCDFGDFFANACGLFFFLFPSFTIKLFSFTCCFTLTLSISLSTSSVQTVTQNRARFRLACIYRESMVYVNKIRHLLNILHPDKCDHIHLLCSSFCKLKHYPIFVRPSFIWYPVLHSCIDSHLYSVIQRALHCRQTFLSFRDIFPDTSVRYPFLHLDWLRCW